jgi:uncharacterized membrane-anchored protein YitT (DUF2179 family)
LKPVQRWNLGAIDFSWRNVRDYGLILIGALLQALSLRLFLIPALLVSGGVRSSTTSPTGRSA